MRWDEGEQRMQLEQFYVDTSLRSLGIGSELLRRAIEHAGATRRGESKGIFLTTGEGNEGAQRLYSKFGFCPSNIPANEPGEIRLELDFEKKAVER